MVLQRMALLLAALSLPVCVAAQQAANPFDGIEGARLIETRSFDGTLYHVQGVAMDDAHIWITSVDIAGRKGYLHQFNRRSLKLERQLELNDGRRFHPGGLSVAGNSIWVPVAEYKPDSSAVLMELDKLSLTIKRKITVADHLGCVAITPDGLIAGNWGSRRLYVFDRAGKQLRVVNNPSPNQYQDIKFVDGMLVGSGNITKTTGAVEWLTWPSLKTLRSVRSGVTDKGRLYTAEAMALEGNDLYLVPEDGPSRLFHFELPNGK